MSITAIEGQLNQRERELLTQAIREAKPKIVIEVGTWLGGGSTLNILKAMEENGVGHLYGIEADRSIYEKMLANLRSAAPDALHRFTPLFGFSHDVIRRWRSEQGPELTVDFAFLDGGNNPREQMREFRLLDSAMPVGSQLMAHDAKLRKGRWFARYLPKLDNWKTQLHDVSEEGLLYAKKTAAKPSLSSAISASMQLLTMQGHPVELAATFLPSSLCGFFLNLLPRRFARRLSDGRK